MATYVFVHGSFHGGWCWQRMAHRLRLSGATVYTPSLTGLGDRKHLLSRDITIGTFVEDIVNLIESEEIDEVILGGHSFGMRVVIGVADRIPNRLSHLVSLDGAIPTDSRSRLESLSATERDERLRRAQEHDGGISVPPPPATFYGLSDPEEIAWVQRRMTPMPMSAEASRLPLHHPPGNGVAGTYIRFTRPAFGNLKPSSDYARTELGWAYHEIECHHDAIISASGEICEILERVAAEPVRHARAEARG